MLRLLASLLNLKPTAPVPAPTPPVPLRGGKRRRRREQESEFVSYYGRPVIKKPHWTWPIWIYFWAGGIAGGASAIAAITELTSDKKQDYSIIRAARYISLGGMLISPVMLIIDLKRPERFYNMLRILKLRSPLSVGTYILTSSGLLSGLNTARQIVEDGWLISEDSLPGKLVLLSANKTTRMLQGIDGIALGGYTGVLLSATAVPLWADMNELISPLFVSSSFSTGAAAISLARALAGTPTKELHRLDGIEQSAILSELSLLGLAAWRLKPQTRKHLYTGVGGQACMAAVGIGMAGPLVLQKLSPKKGPLARPLNILNALMVLTGGFLLRLGIVEAGKQSADDADAYHAITRGPDRRHPS